jgi:hypothetical protein
VAGETGIWPDREPGFRWDRFKIAVAAVCLTALAAWSLWLIHRSSMENRRDERVRIEACRTIGDEALRSICIGRFDS